MDIKKQLKRLNTFGFLSCLRIPDAVWVVLLAGRGFSLFEIGLAEGIFHIVSLVFEIPSGMAADLIGRRRSLAAAGLFGALSAVSMILSGSFFGICLSMAFSALSCSFISGCDEALMYDSLVESKREDHFVSASARYTQIQNIGSMISNAASLLCSVMSYVGFYAVDAFICFLRAAAALSLKEPVVTDEQSLRSASPFQDLGERFKKHIAEVFGFLTSYPAAVGIMLADGFLGLPSYLTLMFIQQRLSELGLNAMWLGLPLMFISLSRIFGVAVSERLRIKNLVRLYSVCSLITGIGTILAGFAPIVIAVLGAMAAAAAMDGWILHLQRYLNSLFPSDRRATLVSTNMMAYSLLMIAASPITGWLGDTLGWAGAGLCVLGASVAAAGVFAAFIGIKKTVS